MLERAGPRAGAFAFMARFLGATTSQEHRAARKYLVNRSHSRSAKAVYERSGLWHLVTSDGRSVPWTPYRYAVYLHWMRQTAQAIGVRPAALELTLFQPPADPIHEQGAYE